MIDLLQYPGTVSVSLIAFTLLLKRLASRNNRAPLPPGPKGYPIIGNVLDISDERPWISYSEMAKKYGDIVMVEVLGTKILILSSYKRMTELMDGRSSVYSDRPPFTMLLEHMGFDSFIALLPYGPKWRRQRRAFHQHFDLKIVSRYYPAMTRGTVEFTKEILASPERFADHTQNFFTRMIIRATYGLEVSPNSDDSYLLGMKDVAEGFFEATAPGRFLVDLIPALKYVPRWMPGTSWRRYADYYRKKIFEVKTEPFELTSKAMKEGRAEPCVMSRIIEDLPPPEDPTRKEEEDLACDLGVTTYLGGSDTSVGTTMTFILLMAMHPEVQKRAQAELDRVVGAGRLPTLEDRPHLLYVNALLRELFRWHQLAPMGLPHATTEDDVYDGYSIPKGTIVMGNLWHIMHDENIFPDPEKFNPDRYIKNGELNQDFIDPIPPSFGFGRRICPGRYLALDSVFLIVTAMLSMFEIAPPKDEAGNSTLKVSFGGRILMLPEPFKCIFSPRTERHAEIIRNLEIQ